MDVTTSSILLVDDEQLLLDVFSHVLTKAGYLTRTVASGQRAIDILKVEKFDLLLLDINMPKINGVQVLEYIKSQDELTDLPVMMLSAEHDNETVLKCISMGAADYIKKPADSELLRSRVWRCLQKHKGLTGSGPTKSTKSQGRARILMVDDDEMLRAILHYRLVENDHIVQQAKSGAEALAALEESDFDLILLDVMMPELDGFQTLQKIKENEKSRHIPVIMVSADDRPATIDKCLAAGADDYVMKPFNTVLLNTRIQSCLIVDERGNVKGKASPSKPQDIVLSLVQRLKNDKIKFPVMPDVAVKVNKLLKEKDDVTPEEVCEIIKPDPTLTMRLISISNSSYYRSSIEIKTIEDAILRLGMRETQNYLLLFTNRALFEVDSPPFNHLLNDLWEHSLATAEAARLIGKAVKYKDLNHLFTLGMLHDMGKLLLIQVLLELQQDGREMDETSILDILNAQHMEFGAALLKKWGFTDEFVSIAQHHHSLDEDSELSQELLIVSLANLMTRKHDFSLVEDDNEDLADSLAARRLNIDSNTIDDALERMKKFVASAASV